MDPGNWATDLAAGSAFGYTLLTAIMLANGCAIFFQVCTLLVQSCRSSAPRKTSPAFRFQRCRAIQQT